MIIKYIHYTIDDATNDITVVTEAVWFDNNHIGVVITIGIRTYQDLSGFPSPVLKARICGVFSWLFLLHQLALFVKTKVSWERSFLNTNPFLDLNCLF